MRITLTEEHKRKIGLANKGRKFTKEWRDKMSAVRKGKHYSRKTEFKKGQIAPNKGKKIIAMQGNKHPNWKGDKVRYAALHIDRKSVV